MFIWRSDLGVRIEQATNRNPFCRIWSLFLSLFFIKQLKIFKYFQLWGLSRNWSKFGDKIKYISRYVRLFQSNCLIEKRIHIWQVFPVFLASSDHRKWSQPDGLITPNLITFLMWAEYVSRLSTTSFAASPSPAIIPVFSVPGRKPRSWPPPNNIG